LTWEKSNKARNATITAGSPFVRLNKPPACGQITNACGWGQRICFKVLEAGTLLIKELDEDDDNDEDVGEENRWSSGAQGALATTAWTW
jgi:hypothetical protein